MITQTYDLNLIPNDQIVNVHVSQYDIGRTIRFNLLNGSAIFSAPSGTTALIEGTKPDKRVFSLNASISGAVASFDTTQNMCAVAGRTYAKFELKNGGKVIGTAHFWLCVDRSGIAEDGDMSTSDLAPYIDAAKDNADRAEQSAKNAAASAQSAAKSAKDAAESAGKAASGSAEDAEAWAVGQRNGVNVGASDETYHNNSKYYSEQANESAKSWAVGPGGSGSGTATNNSKYWAGVAQDAAESALINLGDAGYIGFQIDEKGHLIMTKSAVLEYLDFHIADHKDLIVTVSEA